MQEEKLVKVGVEVKRDFVDRWRKEVQRKFVLVSPFLVWSENRVNGYGRKDLYGEEED